MSVLIVEDNQMEAIVIERTIREALGPIDIINVRTLDEAALVASQCELCVFDLCLPDSAATSSLNWIPSCPCPLIVHSAIEEPILIERAAVVGAKAFVVKGDHRALKVALLFALASGIRDKKRRELATQAQHDLEETLKLWRPAAPNT